MLQPDRLSAIGPRPLLETRYRVTSIKGMSSRAPSIDDLSLPPALLEAPRLFTAWSRERMLVEQNESTPVSPLYHFTREEGLRGILTGQRPWFFSHLQQSDKREFEYALGVARQVLREVGQTGDFLMDNFCACVDDMIETSGLASPFEFYLLSLSSHRDHPPQWQQYGDEGRGYAIGFAPSLFQPDRDELYDEANKNLHMGRVIYGDAATAARHRLAIASAAEIASRIGNAQPELVRQAPCSHYLATMARELLASQLIWNCLTAKEQRFADERETRGVILNVRAKFDPYRQTFNGRNYVEHEMPLKGPGAIAEILIGPHAPTGAEDRVRSLLNAEGYSSTIPVVRSAAVL